VGEKEIGMGYGFEVGEIIITPTIDFDFFRGHRSLVWGLSIGKGFYSHYERFPSLEHLFHLVQLINGLLQIFPKFDIVSHGFELTGKLGRCPGKLTHIAQTMLFLAKRLRIV
jgi:hypothetical protein